MAGASPHVRCRFATRFAAPSAVSRSCAHPPHHRTSRAGAPRAIGPHELAQRLRRSCASRASRGEAVWYTHTGSALRGERNGDDLVECRRASWPSRHSRNCRPDCRWAFGLGRVRVPPCSFGAGELTGSARQERGAISSRSTGVSAGWSRATRWRARWVRGCLGRPPGCAGVGLLQVRARRAHPLRGRPVATFRIPDAAATPLVHPLIRPACGR